MLKAPGVFAGECADAMSEDFLDFLTESVHRYGDVISFTVDGEPWLLLNRPDAIRTVLTASFCEVSAGPAIALLKNTMGRGIVTNFGPSWRSRRSTIQRPLSYRNVQNFRPLIERVIGDQLDNWCSGSTIDLLSETNAFSFSVLSQSLFSNDIAELKELTQALHRVSGANFENRFSIDSFAAVQADLDQLLSEFDKAIYEIVDVRRGDTTRRPQDFLDELLQARDENDRPLDDTSVRDEIATILLAGWETTGATLAWALYLVARHHDVQERLARGVETNLLDQLGTTRATKSIPFPRQVVEETLRLYPSLALIERRALVNLELNDVLVPSGTVIAVSPWLIHRDPRYFDDPVRFDPDRFRAERRTAIPRDCYFPFGAGPKTCPGNHLALLEETIAVGSIFRTHHLQFAGPTDVEPEMASVLQPRHPIRVRVERRA
jgi:cytochrome P450